MWSGANQSGSVPPQYIPLCLAGPDQEWGCTSHSQTSWLGVLVTCRVRAQQLHSLSSWHRNLPQCVEGLSGGPMGGAAW